MLRTDDRTIKVFLVCSGLGHVRRGYEAFMRDCFETLRRDPGLDVWLFKGAGPDRPRDLTLRHLKRNGLAARVVGEFSGRGTYVVEQATFAAALIPQLIRERPDVVYYCDPTIGKLLWYWRRLSGASYRLILHNGGPHPAPFRWCDHVHQLTPWAGRAAIAAGHSRLSQTVIPCGVGIGPGVEPISSGQRSTIRAQLGLPLDRSVVLSVGAINRGHKRMDYLVAEVARMAEPRPFVVMVGESETETPVVRATAELLLGRDGFALRTVPHDEVGLYYRAADVFALASLNEAFGLGYAEAMAHGLPCIAHDYPVSRFVLAEEGLLADLRMAGSLSRILTAVLSEPDSMDRRLRRHRAAADRFGWQVLTRRYVAMIETCVRAQAGLDDAPVEVRVRAEMSPN